MVDFNFASIHLLHSGAYWEGGTFADDGRHGSIFNRNGGGKSRVGVAPDLGLGAEDGSGATGATGYGDTNHRPVTVRTRRWR